MAVQLFAVLRSCLHSCLPLSFLSCRPTNYSVWVRHSARPLDTRRHKPTSCTLAARRRVELLYPKRGRPIDLLFVYYCGLQCTCLEKSEKILNEWLSLNRLARSILGLHRR
ncbi:hypothetical protein J6590_032353 [Homalodisca vitripennis]|nr:hypothetical protein J6590_032353 [Homalodisca vitripennis]